MGLDDLKSRVRDIIDHLQKCSTERLWKKSNKVLKLCSLNDANVALSITDLAAFLNTLNISNILSQADHLAEKLKSVAALQAGGDVLISLSDDLICAIQRTLGCIKEIGLHANIATLFSGVEYNLTGLKNLAETLLLPVNFCTYGPSGYLIGLEIYCLLVIFAEQNSKDKDLRASVASVDAIPLIQLDALRCGAQECLDFALAQQASGAASEDADERVSQWREMVMLTKQLPADLVRGLQQLSASFGLSFLSLVYTKANDARDIEDFLDGVSADQASYPSWSRLVDYVCSEHVINPLHKKPRPVLRQARTTYATLANLHGALVGDALEHAIQKMRKNGFAGFFGSLPRAMAADIDVFIKVAELLPFHRFEAAELDPLWGEHVLTLSHYFLDSLVGDIQEFWADQYDPGQPDGGKGYARLTRPMAELIRLRAFLELCHRHSQYLVFPYNIPSDLYYGILDYPRGLMQLGAGIYGLFTKPPNDTREELKKSLPQDMDSAVQMAKSTLYHHPLRFMTSMAVTDARGGNVTKRLDALSVEQMLLAASGSARRGGASSSSADDASDAEVVIPLAASEIAAADIAAGNIQKVDQVSTVTDLFHYVKNRANNPSAAER